VIERVLAVSLIVLIGIAAIRLYQRRIFRRRVREGLQLDEYAPGRPAVLYFTAPGCVPCRLIQKPALAELTQQVGPDLQIITVDASLDPDLARSWGVLSVPTTFLIDSQGHPRRVNHRAVIASALLEQFRAIGEPLKVLAGKTPADRTSFKVQSRDTREQAG
jgi:thiol-disulfide isomerase/thioredoxin